MKKTVVALYDSRADAQEARVELERAGFVGSAITITDRTGSTGGAAGDEMPSAPRNDHAHSRHEQGILSRLFAWGAPEGDAHVYADGVERGGALLSLGLDDEDIDDALAVLERGKAVDIEERRAGYRPADATGYGATNAGQGSGSGLAGAAEAFQGLNAGQDVNAGNGATAHDEVIPLVEERLDIGKRSVERGGVRVRSYVVETPVQEQVTLRDETVSVERCPVTQQGLDHQNQDRRTDTWGMAPGEPAFQERTIEVTETDEVPVVSKQTRVKEEIVVRKDVEVRVRAVSDTVRRTEVDIEDGRTNPLHTDAMRQGDTKR